MLKASFHSEKKYVVEKKLEDKSSSVIPPCLFLLYTGMDRMQHVITWPAPKRMVKSYGVAGSRSWSERKNSSGKND
jgi:hypothetical protein